MANRDDLEAEYDFYFDETYPAVVIGEFTFEASRVIKELDPIAYREGYWDYLEFSNQSETAAI